MPKKKRPPQRQNGGRKPSEDPHAIQRQTRLTAQQDSDIANEAERLGWTFGRFMREASLAAIGKFSPDKVDV